MALYAQRNKKHLPSFPKHLSSTDASTSRKLCETLFLSSSAHHPQDSSSHPKSSFKRKLKRKTVYKPSSRLKLSSSSPTSHVSVSTYWSHRSKLTSANAIIRDPPLNSHVSLTSSWNHRSKSSSVHAISDSIGSSSVPVSLSPSDQTYGIKAFLSVVSKDPSISDNSSPVLVETVKQTTCNMRTHQKPKAGSSDIRIRVNSPKIARNKTKGRTSKESKETAIVLTSVDPEEDFRESMVEMIVENKMNRKTWKIFSPVIFR